MADVALDRLLPHLRRFLTRPDCGRLSDAELVERFHRHGEEAAFAELVRRHGPMVLGVCRGILRDAHEAEDAFQATFLVLARKAGAIRHQDAVAGWLFRVASHVAAQAAARRQARPRCATEAGTIDMTAGDPLHDLSVRELRQALHQELGRLPERYRVALVLCYLEGRTQDEAARELGCTSGALRGRLVRGRELLRARLTRRGLAPSAGLLALGLAAGAAVPPSVLGETVRAGLLFRKGTAAGAVSARAVALADGAVRALFLGRLKAGGVGLLLAGLLAAATGALAHQGLTQPTPAAREEPARQADAGPQPRVDAFGDPLPDEAVSRFGTLRFRHGESVGFVRFTPDGKVLVSAGGDGLRTWEPATGKLIHFLPLQKATWAGGVDLSPDGKLLAMPAEAGIRLSEVGSARPVRTLRTGKYQMAKFSPDGKTLATVGWDNDDIELWEVSTGRRLWSVSPGKRVMDMAFTPDGKAVVVAGPGPQIPKRTDNAIHYLDAATGRETHCIDLGRDGPFNIALSPNGGRIAVHAYCGPGDSSSSRIRVWEAAGDGDRELPALDPPAPPVLPKYSPRSGHFYGLIFTPDGNSLLTSGSIDQLIEWDLATGKERRRLGRGMADAYALALSPDGKAVAVGHDAWVRVIDRSTGADLVPGSATRLSGNEVSALTADGRTVVTAGPDGFVHWDPATGRERRRLEVRAPYGWRLADDVGTAYTENLTEKAVYCWDPFTGKERLRLAVDIPGEEAVVRGVGPGGKVLAVAPMDGDTVHLVEVATGKRLRSIQVPGRMVLHVNFTADGRTVVVSCNDHTAEVWDLARGVRVRQVGPMGRELGHRRPDGWYWFYATAVSPDGNWLAYSNPGGEFALFDVGTGQELRRLSQLPGGWDGVVAFSPDSRMLAWGGWSDPVVHLMEVASGKERRALAGHRGPARSLSFSADGKTLVSGSADTTALVWDLTGRLSAKGGWGRPLTPADLDACWDALAGADAARAYDALRRLAASPAQAVPYLGERLRPARPADEKRLAGLIADLDSSRFAVREEAARRLERLGDLAVPACRRALAGTPSPDVRRRLEAFVDRQDQERRSPSPDGLRHCRALEALELTGLPDARPLLEALAGGAPEARLTQEARATLDRVTRRTPAAP